MCYVVKFWSFVGKVFLFLLFVSFQILASLRLSLLSSFARFGLEGTFMSSAEWLPFLSSSLLPGWLSGEPEFVKPD